MLFPAIMMPAGCLLFGFGAGQHLSWAILFVGQGMVAVGLGAVAILVVTYTVDSYGLVAEESLVLVNGLKNVVAFGFAYDAINWIEQIGYEKMFGIMSGLTVFVLALAIPLYFFGARIRLQTLNWRIICA